MKFYGQFEPSVDRFIYERYFYEKGIDGVFVECGAFDGVLDSSCKFFEETLGWRGFNFEPVPYIFNDLVCNRPDSRNLNLALSDRCGHEAFKQAIHPHLGRAFGNGSIAHAPSHMESLKEAGCTFEDIEISTTTWKQFIEDQQVTHVDLLVLDVEGHELSVLDGMRNCDVLPDVLCIEFGHIGLDRLRASLGEMGYVYDITSNANAYFVRETKLGLFAMRRAGSHGHSSKSRDANLCAVKTPLVFFHIPKCAGTAFENYILSHGRFAENSRAFTGISKSGKPESLRDYFQCESASPFLFGHFTCSDISSERQNAFNVTFLRDPVKRTISHYKSWHDERNFRPGDPHYATATDELREALCFSQKASLEEFVCSRNPVIVNGALGNQQIRYLSTYCGSDMNEHLRSAKENLRKFDFFGLTDRFKDSIELFRMLAPNAAEYSIHQDLENRSSDVTNEVPDQVKEIIEDQVKYDRLLYDYACQLLEERVRESRLARGLDHQFGEQVSGFRNSTGAVYLGFLNIPFNSGSAEERKSNKYSTQLSALEAKCERIETEARLLEDSSRAKIEQLNSHLEQIENLHNCAVEMHEQSLASQLALVAEAREENSRLQAQVTHIEASYTQLSDLYHQIVKSKSWRAVSIIQEISHRLRLK